MRVEIEIRDTDNSVIGSVDVGQDKDAPLAISMKLASINNISKRGGSYSKTFKIPATKDNNKLLHYLYSSNQKPVKNMTATKDATILVDGKVIERGYIKVVNISNIKNDRYYHCKFFGDNASWMTALSLTSLRDLTFGSQSTGTLTYTQANIEDSWDKLYKNGWDHVYPWISYGQYKNGNGLVTEDFRPAIRYKAIIERSLNSIGYNLSSDFMDTTDFTQGIIFPYVGDGFLHTQDVVDDKLFRASMTDDQICFAHQNQYDPSGSYPLGGLTQKLLFNDDSTFPNFDTGTHYDAANSRYHITVKGKYRFQITAGFKNSGYNTGVHDRIYWRIYKNGAYLDTIDFIQHPSYYLNNQIDVKSAYYILDIGDYVDFRMGYYGVGANLTFDTGNGIPFDVGETITGEAPYFQTAVTSYIFQGAPYVQGNMNLIMPNLTPTGGTPNTYPYWFIANETITGSISGATAEVYAGFGGLSLPSPQSAHYITMDKTKCFVKLTDMSRELVDGNTFELAKILPDMRVLDLFADLTKIFNLYWKTDNKTKTVYVEERDSFYKSTSIALDWSDKLSVDKTTSINFLEDYNRDLIFRYQDDGSDGYLEHRNRVFAYLNNVYCAYKHELPDRFPKGESYVEPSKLSPTYTIQDPNVVQNPLDTRPGITSRLWTENNVDISPPPTSYSFQPRILNYKYGTQVNADGQSLYVDMWNTIETIFPYALAVETFGVTVPYSLSFAQEDGLVSTYYGRTVSVIESALQMSAYFNISSSDFQEMDISIPIYLSEPETVQGYWLIDTVKDYSPFKGLTRVLLTKYQNLDKDGRRIVIDPETSPYPFPTPTTGDFPPDPINVIGHGGDTDTDGTNPGGEDVGKMSIVANNGTGNKALKGAGSMAWGVGCIALKKNQTMMGKYPLNNNDLFAIGIGSGPNDRISALRVDENGEMSMYGGEVLIVNDNGERVPVYIESGTDKVGKKIYMK